MDLNGDNDEQLSDRSETDEARPIFHPPVECNSYTVDDAINKIGMGWFQLKVFFFSCLIWLTHPQITLQNALLAPSWQCEFKITNAELATITTMYSLGNLIGSIPIGILSDKYGRKKVLNICNLFLVFFALFSAFVPNYFWIIIARLILGVLVVSGNQATTYCVEFMPVRFRGPAVIILNISWTLGTGIIVLLSYLIIPTFGWRYIAFISAISGTILPIYYFFVPTSPRFLLQHGKYEEAKKVLEIGAKLNCRSLPEGQLVLTKNEEQPIQSEPEVANTPINLGVHQSRKFFKKGIWEIFNRKYVITTLFLALIWFTSTFLYYNAILITSDLFTYDNHCQFVANTSTSSFPSDYIDYCKPITNNGYLEFFITTLAEVPGILFTVLVLEIIGRKLTFAIEFFVCGIMFFLLFLCTAHSFIVKTVFLFTIRASILGAFGICFLYTGEVYPTQIRASVLAILSTIGRLGSLSSSYSAQVLFRADYKVAIGLFGTLGIITGIVSFLLPHETKGKKIE